MALAGLSLTRADGNGALPDGPGKALVERTCKSCHTLSVITARKRTEDQWVQVISAMLSRGAAATDDEAEIILAYLVKNFGKDVATDKSGDSSAKINVNKATVEQLVALLTISQSEASSIVRYRQENGEYKTLDDLKRVPGLDVKKMEANKDRIIFKSPD